MDSAKCIVSKVVCDAKNVLRSVENKDQFEEELLKLKAFIDGAKSADPNDVHNHIIFMTAHYSGLLDFLLSQLSVDWVACLPRVTHRKGTVKVLFDAFFLDGCPKTAFIVLCNAIDWVKPGYPLNKVVSLLESFLEGSKLEEIFLSSLVSNKAANFEEETLSKFIASLPNRITNKVNHKELPDIFFPQHYIPMVTESIFCALKKVLENPGQKIPEVSLLSLILGKLCITGHAERVWRSLLPLLVPVASSAPWAGVCQRLLLRLPAKHSEVTLRELLAQIAWYGDVWVFLGGAGESVLTDSRLSFLLTHKFILQPHTISERMIQNIIGYLASTPPLRHFFFKVLLSVLDVWGNASALRHSPPELHRHLTNVLLVCAAFYGDATAGADENHTQDVHGSLLHGMGRHLDSGQAAVRVQGMMVGEALTRCVATPGQPDPLSFTYDEDDIVRSMKALLQKPAPPQQVSVGGEAGPAELGRQLAGLEVTTGGMQKRVITTKPTVTGDSAASSDLDSDDDLEPFDMSHDQPATRTAKPPVYLRDCMEGLISSEDVDQVEVCLEAAEKLIRAQTHAVQEISVEFCRLLLHLDASVPLVTAPVLRFRAMLALCVVSPDKVASYLANEFYERNYNTRQRMDMLEVLAAAAQELSSPSQAPKQTTATAPNTQLRQQQQQQHNPKHWKEVVAARIESNTRRFASSSAQRKVPQAVPSRFASVAGSFFFPLIAKVDRSIPGLDLLGVDHLLLSRLIYTLAVIMYSAQHAPINHRMAASLLELIWQLKYHNESSVRQALLFCTSSILLSSSSHTLINTLQTEMIETKHWLSDVARKDDDAECRSLAAQALMLIERAVGQEFNHQVS